MITIKETLLSFPGLEDVSGIFIEKILLSRGLTAMAEYTLEQEKQVNLAVADLYTFMANANDFTESKLSKTYSRDSFLRTVKQLYRENGEPEKAKSLEKKIVIVGKAPNKW